MTSKSTTRAGGIVLAVALAVGATACGSSASSSATAPTSSPPASTAATVVYGWGHAGGGTAKHGKHGKHGGHHQKKATIATSTTGGATGSSGATGSGGELPDDRTPTKISGIDGTVVAVSTSNSDSYALTSAGTVWAWGTGSSGELGNGGTSNSVDPVEVHFPAGVRITSLPDPMPFDGGMAIDSQNTAWGWGNDSEHQFCQPDDSNLTTPTEIPIGKVSLAAGASRHTIYDVAGRIVGCGWGHDGDLGDGSTAGSATPSPVKGLPAGKVTAVTASWGDEGVVVAGGTFYDWGYNAQGQLGDGTTTASDTAVHVPLAGPVRQVSQGGSLGTNGQTLAILTDGSTWVWGAGQQGQIGNGDLTNAPSPVRLDLPSGVSFTAVNSGGATCYGLDTSGRLWSWGSNVAGQVGNDSSASTVAAPVDVGLHLTQVSSTAGNVAGLAKA